MSLSDHESANSSVTHFFETLVLSTRHSNECLGLCTRTRDLLAAKL